MIKFGLLVNERKVVVFAERPIPHCFPQGRNSSKELLHKITTYSTLCTLILETLSCYKNILYRLYKHIFLITSMKVIFLATYQCPPHRELHKRVQTGVLLKPKLSEGRL